MIALYMVDIYRSQLPININIEDITEHILCAKVVNVGDEIVRFFITSKGMSPEHFVELILKLSEAKSSWEKQERG